MILMASFLNLNSAVGAVARRANVLKIGIFFGFFKRKRSHLYGEFKKFEKNF